MSDTTGVVKIPLILKDTTFLVKRKYGKRPAIYKTITKEDIINLVNSQTDLKQLLPRRTAITSNFSWTEFKKRVSKGKPGEQGRGFLNTLSKAVKVEFKNER